MLYAVKLFERNMFQTKREHHYECPVCCYRPYTIRLSALWCPKCSAIWLCILFWIFGTSIGILWFIALLLDIIFLLIEESGKDSTKIRLIVNYFTSGAWLSYLLITPKEIPERNPHKKGVERSLPTLPSYWWKTDFPASTAHIPHCALLLQNPFSNITITIIWKFWQKRLELE